MRRLRTNRVVSKDDAKELALAERVEMEARITDSFARPLPVVAPGWQFEDYANHNPWRREMFDHLGPLEGKTILDLGCGWHPTPVYFALAGAARVVATDVSPKAIEHVEQAAAVNGVADRIEAVCCPAEDMPFADDEFDLVHGEAVLHHLQLDDAGVELARVMRPGARGAFKDPLGHNKVLEAARDHLPYAWKHAHKGTDEPLTIDRLEQFGRSFRLMRTRGHGLLSLVPTYLSRRRRTTVVEVTEKVDEQLLEKVPVLQRYARFTTVLVAA
jgi:2-polyprenyl-3-methyl-5-hydroxy-6-metoxy-1,4-benzoquinol methylase